MLASLDPVPTPKQKRSRRKVALLTLLAVFGGAGLAIPRFATQETIPNSMMIIKPLPKGLTLVSLTEDPGGAPYWENGNDLRKRDFMDRQRPSVSGASIR